MLGDDDAIIVTYSPLGAVLAGRKYINFRNPRDVAPKVAAIAAFPDGSIVTAGTAPDSTRSSTYGAGELARFRTASRLSKGGYYLSKTYGPVEN